MNSHQYSRLIELRRMKEEEVIQLALNHGAVLYKTDPKSLVNPELCWAVLDQPAYPRLWYAYFPSKYTAAMQYCMEHQIP